MEQKEEKKNMQEDAITKFSVLTVLTPLAFTVTAAIIALVKNAIGSKNNH